jgi:DNA/RNA-binding domain of Phe-tRNA-synthetase-like protein
MDAKLVEIDQSVLQAYPLFSVFVIFAENLANGPSDDISTRLLREAEAEARATFGDASPATHPHIKAWRSAYSKFGSKPSKYFSSVESLLRRALRNDQIPAINRLVDAYNAISLRHVLPVGGEDARRIVGLLRLYRATGSEHFEAAPEDDAHPVAGEVVWGDDLGVTCRRWNWRQGLRTRLEPNTTAAIFVLERLPPFSIENLDAAGRELIQSLRVLSPDCKVEYSLLGSDQGE